MAVELSIESANQVATIHDVCAILPGATEPDRIVLLGNHRDAWVFGGADPNSGTATMLEVARSLSVLRSLGYTPRRTIMLCSWDAEEAGTIGSSEWVERNRELLSTQLVSYLNVDTTVSSGRLFEVAGMPNLDDVIISTAKQVPAPAEVSGATQNQSLYDLWAAQGGGVPRIGRLGKPRSPCCTGTNTPGDCSSDYCSFVCHLGASSVDMRFSPGYTYPMYHRYGLTAHVGVVAKYHIISCVIRILMAARSFISLWYLFS